MQRTKRIKPEYTIQKRISEVTEKMRDFRENYGPLIRSIGIRYNPKTV